MRVLAFVALVTCFARVAAADDRPWARGVSDADQKAALALYDEGNKSFEESEYRPALDKYEKALEHWKHPAIYFNAAVCLYNLDQDLKAYDYIEKALQYGDAPFDKKLFKQANDYKTLLSARVTELEVSCKQDSVRISLDGETLMTNCPSSATRRVLVAKEHEIVGTKDGYKPETIGPIKLAPGEKKTIEIVLVPLDKGRLVRRWNRKLPWLVAGVGGAVVLAGFAPTVWARHNQSAFDDDIVKACPTGCATSDPRYQGPLALHDRAVTETKVATGMFIGGGLLAVAGFAMVVLNQPHLEHAVVPSVGPDHAGVSIVGRW